MSSHSKHPRIWHLPWSPGLSGDDRVIQNLSAFEGHEVVATLKLDGENTTLYHDGLHARSLDYVSRVDRDWMKAVHAALAHEIPLDIRICGENVWAEHSIRYEHLASFFYVHSVWDEDDVCLSWDETEVWAALLDLPVVPVLYRGPWDERVLRDLHHPEHAGDACEGYVVRTAGAISKARYPGHVAKFVRAGHVQTEAHWSRVIRPNPFVARLKMEGAGGGPPTGPENRSTP